MEVRSNDEVIFRQVFDKVFPMLMKVVYHIVYNADVAEEICQEAFIRFYDKQMVFPSVDEATYWLIRVAKNLAINQIKRKDREKNMVEKLGNDPMTFKSETPDEVVLKKAEKARVQAAIEKLPEKYRSVILIRTYTDMDYAQIGKILHISENNVKIRIFRARKALEKLLTE